MDYKGGKSATQALLPNFSPESQPRTGPATFDDNWLELGNIDPLVFYISGGIAG